MERLTLEQLRLLRERDLSQLALLLALLRTRSVSETARHLRMAQPSVSRALDRLRTDLGDRLLVRSGNAMVRTTKADMLLPRLELLFAELNDKVYVNEAFSPLTVSRTLTVACNEYLQALMAPAILRFMAIHAPLVTLRFTVSGHGGYDALVKGGIADMAICGERGAMDLRSVPIGRERFVAVVDCRNEAVGASLGLEAFCALTHIDHSPTEAVAVPGLISRRIAELGHRRRVLATMNSASAIAEVLRGSAHVSVWYRTVARVTRLDDPAALRVLPLAFDLLTSEIVLSWGEQTHEDRFQVWARREVARLAAEQLASSETLPLPPGRSA